MRRIPLTQHGEGSEVTVERRSGSALVSVFFTTAYVDDLMLLTDEEVRALHAALGEYLNPEVEKDDPT